MSHRTKEITQEAFSLQISLLGDYKPTKATAKEVQKTLNLLM